MAEQQLSGAQEPPVEDNSPFNFNSARRRRQAGLFFGGVAFVAFSSIITRRSLARRYRTPAAIPINPAGPHTANALARRPLATTDAVAAPPHPGKLASQTGAEAAAAEAEAADVNNSGPIVAVEALGLATVNVISWAIMTVGGAAWYFDISTLEDLRKRVRGGLGVDGSGRTEEELEEEMEEWLAGVLARKEEKSRVKDEVEALRRGRFNERGKPR